VLDRPHTTAEPTDASPIYGGRSYAPGVLDYWEGQMIGKHLARQGRVRRIEREEADLRGPEVNVGGTVRLQGAATKPDRFTIARNG